MFLSYCVLRLILFFEVVRDRSFMALEMLTVNLRELPLFHSGSRITKWRCQFILLPALYLLYAILLGIKRLETFGWMKGEEARCHGFKRLYSGMKLPVASQKLG